VVGPHVTLQDGTKLHHHVTVEGYTTIGENCEVFPQAVLGAAPQDLKYRGERTTLEIGKGNIFREMVTVHPGTANGGGVTRIGDNNLFLIGVHVAHDCRIGNRCVIANYVQFAGHVHVHDNVNMGGASAVHHFVTIGRHAFVGGMTRVATDVPPFVIMVAARGTRSEIRMINGVGLQRSGFSNEDIQTLKTAYMRLFSRKARTSNSSMRDRVQALLEEQPVHPLVAEICGFMLRSFDEGRHGRYLEARRADPVHRNSWKLDERFTLTINVMGRGRVDRVRCEAAAPAKTAGANGSPEVYELTAAPEPGWRFSGWDGSLSGQANPQAVILDTNKSVAARFVPMGG
jgi:UDP-N-acetylglucosamine acyltransferase